MTPLTVTLVWWTASLAAGTVIGLVLVKTGQITLKRKDTR